MSPFYGASGTPCFRLRLTLPIGFKVHPHLPSTLAWIWWSSESTRGYCCINMLFLSAKNAGKIVNTGKRQGISSWVWSPWWLLVGGGAGNLREKNHNVIKLWECKKCYNNYIDEGVSPEIESFWRDLMTQWRYSMDFLPLHPYADSVILSINHLIEIAIDIWFFFAALVGPMEVRASTTKT